MFTIGLRHRGKTDSREAGTGPRDHAVAPAECVTAAGAVDEALLELVGPTMTSDAARSPAWPAGPDAPHDLVQTLYEQYCGALDAPLASLANEWAAQTARPDLPPPVIPATQARNEERADSIDVLLSGARTIDQVLSQLGPADAPDPATAEPIPEILRLFAPAEHETAARRAGYMPPPLARREHQALAIDSPLAAPGTTPEPHG